MGALAQTSTSVLWAAVVSAAISAIVSSAVSYYWKQREIEFGLVAKYEDEQVREIRALIGRFHGRLLHAAFSWNKRMWNLYANADRHWLDAGGRYSHLGYYFGSTVYRYLRVFALVHRFEDEAVYLDARLARPQDFAFMNYMSALSWCATDTALFKGLDYDDAECVDHFFSDDLRRWSDSLWSGDEIQNIDAFETREDLSGSLVQLPTYFDGLDRAETRLRWDRLVALHLVTMAFINSFGYATQRSSFDHFRSVCSEIEHPAILRNLVSWLPRLGLDDDGALRLKAAALEVLAKPATSSAAS